MPKVPQRALCQICDANLMHVLWRGPGEVQIGTDAGRSTIFTNLTSAEERVLLAVPRLSDSAREQARLAAGIEGERWAEFTAHFVKDEPYRPIRGMVVALDSHPITERVRSLLGRIGVESSGGGQTDVGRRVAVLTDAWVTDPLRIHELLAADVPYLPIVIEESGTVVGPSVVPGATPCTTCIHLARTRADPKWPVMATQLRTVPQRRLSLMEIETAAALATHALAGLLSGHASGGWHVSDERCLPLAAPRALPCGCGALTPLSEGDRDRA